MSETTTVSVTISPDYDGYTGRECPNCERYFKVMLGTGLSDTTAMYCPYCQTNADSDQFFTKEQIAYAQSVALGAFQSEILDGLRDSAKGMTLETGGLLNIKVSAEVTGEEITIEHYTDQALETEVTCETCGLSYKIYGVFATCPDCATHNSKQILTTNLEVLRKQLDSATDETHARLLKDAVSIFDAYGRTTTEHHTGTRISFQNLVGAEKNLQVHGLSLRAHTTREEWEFLTRSFQKRHVLTHNLGVADEDYIVKANDPDAIIDRKIRLTGAEVERTIDLLTRLSEQFTRSAPAPADSDWVIKREAIKKNPYQLNEDALRLARLLFSHDEHGYTSGYVQRADAQRELGLPDLAFEAALVDLTEHQLVTIESYRLLASTETMPLAIPNDLDYDPTEDDKLVAQTLIKEERSFAATELETLTSLPKDRLNRSSRRLKKAGAIELRTGMGTAPYAFRTARATGNTLRYLRNRT